MKQREYFSNNTVRKKGQRNNHGNPTVRKTKSYFINHLEQGKKVHNKDVIQLKQKMENLTRKNARNKLLKLQPASIKDELDEAKNRKKKFRSCIQEELEVQIYNWGLIEIL